MLSSSVGAYTLAQTKGYGGDFFAYWVGSYQLARGESFADSAQLRQIKGVVAPAYNGPVDTWNPPWVMPLFIPLTWLPFEFARLLWLDLSICGLRWCAWSVWRIMAPNSLFFYRDFAVLLIVTLFFPATAWLLVIEQISILLLIGLVGFLVFHENRPILAGFFLFVTTIKPHIVFILLPVLLLELLLRRQYKTLIAFFGMIALFSIVTFGLRPTFLVEYFNKVDSGPIFTLLTPSLPVLLGHALVNPMWRLIGVFAAPLIWLAWLRVRYDAEWEMTTIVVWGIFASLLLAPYGYGFDFIILLLAWWQLFIWLQAGLLSAGMGRFLLLSSAGVTIIFLSFELLQILHVYALWVPIYVCVVYGVVAMNRNSDVAV